MRSAQPATALSGGEASASSSPASRPAARCTLDEPITGLHFGDVKKLLEILQRLVDGGYTVLVIEHMLPVRAATTASPGDIESSARWRTSATQ